MDEETAQRLSEELRGHEYWARVYRHNANDDQARGNLHGAHLARQLAEREEAKAEAIRQRFDQAEPDDQP